MVLSVIIPTYNRYESLRRTLDCIFSISVQLPDEIIIVDQTIDPVIRAQISEKCAKYDIVRLVRAEKPSLTAARNIGMREAKGDVLIFMDDDVDVKPDTFAKIIELFSDAQLAMIAGINEADLLNPAPSILGRLFGKSSIKKKNIGHVTKAVYGRFPCRMDKTVETEWAMGFFFAIRKNIAMENHIWFDEKLRYYAYAEDLDYTFRYSNIAKNHGLKSIVTPDVIVRHNISTEYRTPKKDATFMVVLHRAYLSHKLFGTKFSQIASIWSNVGDWLLSRCLSVQARHIIAAHFFLLKHYNDILSGNFHYEDFRK